METWKAIGDGAYCIDTHLIKTGHTACYLIVDDGEVAVFDSGANSSVPFILETLQALHLAPEQVKYHISSHIHLDHAGGSGLLMKQLPNATMLIHPEGAPHMIDPANLVQGTIGVYGKAFVDKTYGSIIPVSPSRIVSVRDGQCFTLGRRTLEVLFTPGHAWNHISILDNTSSIAFAGDSMGISYESALPNNKRFLFPASPPTHFNSEAMIASIKRQGQSGVRYFALTHYGLIENKPYWTDLLVERIGAYIDMTMQAPEGLDFADDVFDGLRGLFKKWLSKDFDGQVLDRLVADHEGDVFISGSGLIHWLKRQREKAQAI